MSIWQLVWSEEYGLRRHDSQFIVENSVLVASDYIASMAVVLAHS